MRKLLLILSLLFSSYAHSQEVLTYNVTMGGVTGNEPSFDWRAGQPDAVPVFQWRGPVWQILGTVVFDNQTGSSIPVKVRIYGTHGRGFWLNTSSNAYEHAFNAPANAIYTSAQLSNNTRYGVSVGFGTYPAQLFDHGTVNASQDLTVEVVNSSTNEIYATRTVTVTLDGSVGGAGGGSDSTTKVYSPTTGYRIEASSDGDGPAGDTVNVAFDYDNQSGIPEYIKLFEQSVDTEPLEIGTLSVASGISNHAASYTISQGATLYAVSDGPYGYDVLSGSTTLSTAGGSSPFNMVASLYWGEVTETALRLTVANQLDEAVTVTLKDGGQELAVFNLDAGGLQTKDLNVSSASTLALETTSGSVTIIGGDLNAQGTPGVISVVDAIVHNGTITESNQANVTTITPDGSVNGSSVSSGSIDDGQGNETSFTFAGGGGAFEGQDVGGSNPSSTEDGEGGAMINGEMGVGEINAQGEALAAGIDEDIGDELTDMGAEETFAALNTALDTAFTNLPQPGQGITQNLGTRTEWTIQIPSPGQGIAFPPIVVDLTASYIQAVRAILLLVIFIGWIFWVYEIVQIS